MLELDIAHDRVQKGECTILSVLYDGFELPERFDKNAFIATHSGSVAAKDIEKWYRNIENLHRYKYISARRGGKNREALFVEEIVDYVQEHFLKPV
mgnify:CR=1 FL=1